MIYSSSINALIWLSVHTVQWLILLSYPLRDTLTIFFISQTTLVSKIICVECDLLIGAILHSNIESAYDIDQESNATQYTYLLLYAVNHTICLRTP